jgi:hypothetical protein
VQAAGGRLSVRGATGDGMDALRALAVASWRAVDDGHGPGELVAGDPETAAVIHRLGLAPGTVGDHR